MTEEKMLTVREVSSLLGISEKEVMELAESGKVPAYKVGGVYLRFKKDQVTDYLKSSHVASGSAAAAVEKYTFIERLNDFFYFNDFYLLAFFLILLLLFVIFRGN